MQGPRFVGQTAKVSRSFYVHVPVRRTDMETDMNALLNAHTTRGCDPTSHIGLTADVFPEAQRSETGVSSEYVRQDGYSWFALRATYGRQALAYEKANQAGITAYMPMHYVQKTVAGKKKRILQPLLPGLFFIYATREQADRFVKKGPDAVSFIKYYLDKTLVPEANGKNPPLTISYDAMANFIKATNTDNEHVRIVSQEQCRYKSGDMVRVTDGEFEGVVGKVARIAGQQRVVVEISGLCLVATAYIPSDFMELVK